MAEFEYNPDISRAMTQGLNNSLLNNNIDPGAFRSPNFFVYIHSVSRKQFEVRRPPQVPLLILKPCPEDKKSICVAKFADPFEQADRDVDTGEVRMRFHPGKSVAQDIVCPNAPDMDSPASAWTVDLREQGVFWSLHNPPLPEEEDKALARLEKYYRKRLERATALEYTNPKQLLETLSQDDHLAADYFGEEYSWHKARVKKVKVVAKVPCPVCGDEIKPGVAFHKDSEGEYCILDWKRAYEAGRVTKKQIPEDKRWEGLKVDV